MKKSKHSRHTTIEGLERRTLFSSTLVPLPDAVVAVYDPARSLLYVATEGGKLERYDAAAGQLIEPLDLGFPPAAMDIAPNGSALFLTERTDTGGAGAIHRVDLANGAVEEFAVTLPERQVPGDELVVAGNGDVLFNTYDTSDAFGRPAAPTLLHRFDPDTQTVSTNFGSADAPRAYEADDGNVVRSPDGSRVLVTNQFGHIEFTASLLDGDLNVITPTKVVTGYYGGVMSAISGDGSLLAMGDNQVYDAQFTPVNGMGSNASAKAVAFDATQPVVYHTGYGGSTVLEAFDVATRTRTRTETVSRDYPVAGLSLVTTPQSDLFFVLDDPGVYVVRFGPRVDVDSLPTYVRRGVAYPITVSLEFPDGLPDPTATGTIHFASTGAAFTVPADFTFTAADAGKRTFPVTFDTDGTVTLTASEVGGGGSSDSAQVVVDGVRPVATLAGTFGPTEPSAPMFINVDYDDDVRLDWPAAGAHSATPVTGLDDDLVVVAPDGTTYPVMPEPDKLNSPITSSGTGEQRRLYHLDPIGGSWGREDNGTYRIRLGDGGGVFDFAGNPALPDADLGTFTINVNGRGQGVGADALLAGSVVPGSVPAQLIGGAKVRASVLVENVGSDPVSGEVDVSVTLRGEDGSAVAARAYAVGSARQRVRLAPGASKVVKVKLQIPQDVQTGTYRFQPAVTPNGVVFGADAGRSAPVQVTEGAANLRALDIEDSPIFLRDARVTRAVTFRVRNDGNIPGGGRYNLYLGSFAVDEDGDLLPGNSPSTVFAVPRKRVAIHLKPGQEKAVTLTVRGGAGYYHLFLDARRDGFEGDFIN